MDPSKAMVAIEGGKSRVKMAEIAAGRESDAKRLQLDGVRLQEETDYKRDKLTQDRVIELAKLGEGKRSSLALKQSMVNLANGHSI